MIDCRSGSPTSTFGDVRVFTIATDAHERVCILVRWLSLRVLLHEAKYLIVGQSDDSDAVNLHLRLETSLHFSRDLQDQDEDTMIEGEGAHLEKMGKICMRSR